MVTILLGSLGRRRATLQYIALLVLSQVEICHQSGKKLKRIRGTFFNLYSESLYSYSFTDRWLYALFLAIDANFRLCRRNKSSEQTDPSLSNGWAYFVEQCGFKEVLDAYSGQVQEVRHCSQLVASDWLTLLSRKVPAQVIMRLTLQIPRMPVAWLPQALAL